MSEDVKELMDVVKLKARALGVTQAELATRSNVSLPTLKRWLNGVGISVDNLLTMLKALGLTLEEVASTLPSTNPASFYYSDEQENFLSENLQYLSYFDHLIQGWTPKKIERVHQLSARSTQRYLKVLEEIGLIQRLPSGKVKLEVQGEPIWREQGILATKLKELAVNEFTTQTLSKAKMLSLYLHNYSSEDAETIRQELANVCGKAQSFHRKSMLMKQDSNAYGLLIGLAPFQWRLLKNVPNL